MLRPFKWLRHYIPQRFAREHWRWREWIPIVSRRQPYICTCLPLTSYFLLIWALQLTRRHAIGQRMKLFENMNIVLFQNDIQLTLRHRTEYHMTQ